MASCSPFLSLPRELRDMVYDHYVSEPDGYHFEYSSGKLRTSEGKSIDLALMYTCKWIAAEMHGLPLERNTINFSTISLGDDDWRARHFQNILDHWDEQRWTAVFRLGHDRSPLETTQMIEMLQTAERLQADLLKSKYPRLELKTMNYSQGTSGAELPRNFIQILTEGRWIASEFLKDLLRETCDHTGFRECYAKAIEKGGFFNGDPIELTERHTQIRFVRSAYFSRQPDYWDMPTEEEILEMGQFARKEPVQPNYRLTSWRYSAAAAAVSFLHSLRPTTRKQIRHVLLYEDYPSVAQPQCHAIGLIPFCQENSKLHVTRKVNFWTAMMSQAAPYMPESCQYGDEMFHIFDEQQRLILSKDEGFRVIRMANVTYYFVVWLAEVRALFLNGMPFKSFSLIFDGNPILEQSSEALEIIKQDAAWQAAQELYDEEHPINAAKNKKRYWGAYFCKDFHKMVANMVGGTSPISCNFPLGDLYDAQSLKSILEAQSKGRTGWRNAWLLFRGRMLWKLFPPGPDEPRFRLEAVGYKPASMITPDVFRWS